jgi:hypothetical protein
MVTPETRRLDQTFFTAAFEFSAATDSLTAAFGSLGGAAGATAGSFVFVVESALLESSIEGFSAIPRGGRIGP